MPVFADPRIGSELAGYRLDELDGCSRVGVIYRAHDLALDQSVALKLSPDLAQDPALRQEGRTLFKSSMTSAAAR